MGFKKVIEVKLALARYNNEKLEEQIAKMSSDEVKWVKIAKTWKERCLKQVTMITALRKSEKRWIADSEVALRERDELKIELNSANMKMCSISEDNEKMSKRLCEVLQERNDVLNMSGDQIRKRLAAEKELSDVYTLTLCD